MNSIKNFSFSEENLITAKEIISHYPIGRQQSALLPLLTIAQKQNNGWLAHPVMEYIAELLEIPFIRVYEVATFYTMFNLKPVGKYHLQICGTTPCWLRGAKDIIKLCEDEIGIKCGESSEQFSISEVECLGACVNAPVVQINNEDYIEDLSPEIMKEILKKMKNSQFNGKGSQIGRNGSKPQI